MKRIAFSLFFGTVGVVALVVAPTKPAAASGNVVINEIMANPLGTDTGNEWVELTNAGDTAAAIGGVRVIRGSGTVIATIPAGTVLPVGGYLKVAVSTLLNAGDTLSLHDVTQQLDNVTYDGSGTEGWSWVRLTPTSGSWTKDVTPGSANASPIASPLPSPSSSPSPVLNASPTVVPSPTPTLSPMMTPLPTLVPTASPTPTPMPTMTPTPVPLPLVSPFASPLTTPSPTPSAEPTPDPAVAPGEIWINELLPNPVGSDTDQEWLELKNVSANAKDVTGLKVIRESGSVVVTVPAALVGPGETLLLSNLSGTLVNGGDTLQVHAGGVLIDQVTYDEAAEGQSWIRLDATSGSWTTTLTPGSENVLTTKAEPSAEPTATSVAAGATSTAASTAAKAPAKKAATKAAAKKTTSKAASKLPKTGLGLGAYALPLVLAIIYGMRRWKQSK